LKEAKLVVKEEVAVPIKYKEVELDHGYRIDLLVENTILLELKVVEGLNDVHRAQVLTYLRFGGYKIGYLINFNSTTLKDNIKRFVI
jgi:GxxExxY protein